MTVIQDVKSRSDIVDVVSDRVALAKSGSNFKAACPFHAEKTPSFYVFPDRQTWRCFGACAEGGDVISFTMKAENLDFAQALNQLADRAGVTIPTPADQETGGGAGQGERGGFGFLQKPPEIGWRREGQAVP